MTLLKGIGPERVMHYFEEICKIPHGSGNTKQISDYLVSFAKQRDLWVYQDEHDNVIIKKPACKGYETAPTVIIQGHIDMVLERDDDSATDPEQQGLDLCYENGFLFAKGTTLGGDDGIAIAYGLAILESDSILHPALEMVFTSDEEIGMLGAAALDMSKLSGKIMLNLDSEEEGHLLVGCAGGMTAVVELSSLTRETVPGIPVQVELRGLTGGHSGVEIHKQRANANVVMGRILERIAERMELRLVEVNGGAKDNAIPRSAVATLVVKDLTEMDLLKGVIDEIGSELKAEWDTVDPEMELKAEVITVSEENEDIAYFCRDDARRIIGLLRLLPAGVQRMSDVIPGMVETSLNLGILRTEGNSVRASLCLRSSVTRAKEELAGRVKRLAELLGASYSEVGDYPGWEIRKESPLRELMTDIYREKYGEDPIVESMHAGVECGLFAAAIPDFDCVSFGPNLLDIHTTQERMDVASVERIWEYLLAILERIKE